MMLAASPAFAFYHSDEQSEGSVFQKERCFGGWDNGERAFALYDNLNCPLRIFGDVHKIITLSLNSGFFKPIGFAELTDSPFFS